MAGPVRGTGATALGDGGKVEDRRAGRVVVCRPSGAEHDAGKDVRGLSSAAEGVVGAGEAQRGARGQLGDYVDDDFVGELVEVGWRGGEEHARQDL